MAHKGLIDGGTQPWLSSSPDSIFKQKLRAALPALPSPPCKYTLFLIVHVVRNVAWLLMLASWLLEMLSRQTHCG